MLGNFVDDRESIGIARSPFRFCAREVQVEYGGIAALGCPVIARKHEKTEIIPMMHCYTPAAGIKLNLRIAELLPVRQNCIMFKVLGVLE
jgi:hypothetical protein